MHQARRALLSLTAALAFALVGAVGSAQAFTYVSTFGSAGSGDGQFQLLNQIALDPAGNVYGADGGNGRIERFAPDGTFVAQIGGPGNAAGQFASPYGVAVDATGSFLYATDDGAHNSVNEYSSSGSFVRSWGGSGTGDGQFDVPSGVAVAPNGDVYVSDNSNNRVQEFTSTGAFVRKWGSSGSGDGQFDGPDGVAVDSAGNVWVSEDQNHRLQEFSGTGGFIRRVTSIDGEPFGGPFAISTDAAGHLWVSDEKAVEELDGNGNFLAAYGGGTGSTAFDELNGLAVDCHGVYAADGTLDRVELFSDPSIPACPGSAPAPSPPATPAAGPPALSLALVTTSSQGVLRQHGIVLTVSADVAATVTAGAKARGVKFKSATARLTAGTQRQLKLGLTKKALGKLRGALRSHRSLKAAVTVSVKDAAGKVVISHRSVRLTR
jgi:DNA-binding beta-propeller fold protein YncE